MKNQKYFPFERNRYFYGKFLNAEDFESEQRYMNDKRRLINRFLHGGGVVCGLQAVRVDDLTLSVEAGFALDYTGREIIVPYPVTKRLSSIEGYSCGDGAEKKQELYLCVSYAEEDSDPVYNITNINGEDSREYNKYSEGYRLFVTEEKPDTEAEQDAFLYEDSRTVFHENGIWIRQSVPRYMQSGGEAELTITVEKSDQVGMLAFSYQLKLNNIEHQGKNIIEVDFDESLAEASDTYVIKKRLRAKTAAGIRGNIEMVPGSFWLSLDSYKMNPNEKEKIKFKVSLISDSVGEAFLREYYQASLDEAMTDPYKGHLYLARLEVIRAGDTYVIDRVENLPYGQRVWNGRLSGAMERFRMGREPKDFSAAERIQREGMEKSGVGTEGENGDDGGEDGRERMTGGFSKSSSSDVRVRSGSAQINLGIGMMSGKRFYSEEIIHGLGRGRVFINLALEREEDEKELIFGSGNIFAGDSVPNIVMAAKLNPEKGSFAIGIQCLGYVNAEKLRIRWMAVKDGAGEKDQPEPLVIRPNIVKLSLREGCCFEAEAGGRAQRNIKWSVKDPDGGIIDDNGCYTAPNKQGIYIITARRAEGDGGSATAYAVVFDRAT